MAGATAHRHILSEYMRLPYTWSDIWMHIYRYTYIVSTISYPRFDANIHTMIHGRIHTNPVRLLSQPHAIVQSPQMVFLGSLDSSAQSCALCFAAPRLPSGAALQPPGFPGSQLARLPSVEPPSPQLLRHLFHTPVPFICMSLCSTHVYRPPIYIYQRCSVSCLPPAVLTNASPMLRFVPCLDVACCPCHASRVPSVSDICACRRGSCPKARVACCAVSRVGTCWRHRVSCRGVETKVMSPHA